MLPRIISALKNCGAADAGAVSIERLRGKMSSGQSARLACEMPKAHSLICAIFPYFSGFAPGNLSLYARGTDYHLALGRRLDFAARGLKEMFPEHDFKPYIDASPFPEGYAAALCGLGMVGANGLIIRPPYGSFVFIGTIATTLELDAPWSLAPCKMCGKCAQMCPAQAISPLGVDAQKCLSAVTQRKGALDAHEREAVRRGQMVWGCDICQKVCPLNRDLAHTVLPEFSRDLLHSLTRADVQVSNREFAEKYGDRAFAWRGVSPIKRNIDILGL